MSEDGLPAVAALFGVLSHSRRRADILLVACTSDERDGLWMIGITLSAVDYVSVRVPTHRVPPRRTALTRNSLDTLAAAAVLTQEFGDRLVAGPAVGRTHCVIALASVRGTR